MAEQELTPWFDGHVNPVNYGVYERDIGFETGAFSLWNGSHWMAYMPDPECAQRERVKSERQYLPWRGLAVKPK